PDHEIDPLVLHQPTRTKVVVAYVGIDIAAIGFHERINHSAVDTVVGSNTPGNIAGVCRDPGNAMGGRGVPDPQIVGGQLIDGTAKPRQIFGRLPLLVVKAAHGTVAVTDMRGFIVQENAFAEA